MGFLFASFVFLSFVQQKKQDINSKNWWVIYFENPKNESLNFSIENHSDDANFHWEIFSQKTKIKEGDVSVEKGVTKTIPVSSSGITDKKITISIADNKGTKKEIYKGL